MIFAISLIEKVATRLPMPEPAGDDRDFSISGLFSRRGRSRRNMLRPFAVYLVTTRI